MSTRPTPLRRVVGAVDRQALADGIPLFVPAIPFAFVVGLAVTESELPAAIGWATSPLIFAGAAQLAVITLAGSASLWAVVIAGFVINTRHVMYSAALSPRFREQPRWMRLLAPLFLIDQLFALSSLRPQEDPHLFRRYYLTAAGFFYIGWIASTTLGMIIGPAVPDSWRLDFAPPIMFAGMVVFMARNRPAVVAAIVGGLVGLLAVGLRDRLGILIGAVAGVIAGTVAEIITTRDAEVPAPVDEVVA